MFSFFRTKKHSPDTPSETDPIPGPDPKLDDFLIVDKEPKEPGSQPQGPQGLYPSIYPPAPIGAHGGNHPPFTQTQQQPIHFLQGVPFKLSPQISTSDSTEITRVQIQDILSFINMTMQRDSISYDFSVERNVIN